MIEGYPDVEIAVIAAVGRNGAVGRDGALPWHLPDDLQHFKRETRGHCVVLGKRTWAEIGKPLPGRAHVVVSATLAAAGGVGFPAVQVVADLDDALRLAAGHERRRKAEGAIEVARVFVIGGTRLWAEAWPYVDRAILTEVDASPVADTFFPDVDFAGFERAEVRDGEGEPRHRFVVWLRSARPRA